VRHRNASHRAARDLIESGQPLFLAKTVAPGTGVGLRGYYGLPGWRRCRRFVRPLAGPHPGLTAEDRPAPGARPWPGWAMGSNFADALTMASLPQLRGDGSFDDRGFVPGAVAQLNLAPRLFVPAAFLTELGLYVSTNLGETAAARSWCSLRVIHAASSTQAPLCTARRAIEPRLGRRLELVVLDSATGFVPAWRGRLAG